MSKLAHLLAALVALMLLVGCGKPERFNSTDVTGADFASDFSLTDHTGKPRKMADFSGKAVVLFFGYTQCPDVCPTTLSSFAQVMKLLGPDAQRVQVLFVTLDPERDTRELLAQYVPAFNPGFLGLYGDAAATAATAKAFRVFFQRQPGKDGTSYTIDHSAGSFVFDPTGKLRLHVSHGSPPEGVAEDLKRLLSGK